MAGSSWAQLLAQLADLGIALVLCAAIGLERELQQKSAGLRTHSLVGLGAASFMVISKYGFADVLGGHVMLDPSRVAAGIVSGIGFIGAGLIFVRSDAVRGLTTASVIWVTAAVGTAAGAGMWVVATAVTLGHFLVVLAFPPLLRAVPRARWAAIPVEVTYEDGRGVLRSILEQATTRGFSVSALQVRGRDEQRRAVSVAFDLRGRAGVDIVTAAIATVDGVESVRADADR